MSIRDRRIKDRTVEEDITIMIMKELNEVTLAQVVVIATEIMDLVEEEAVVVGVLPLGEGDEDAEMNFQIEIVIQILIREMETKKVATKISSSRRGTMKAVNLVKESAQPIESGLLRPRPPHL